MNKIFGIGLAKTGTKSLIKALKVLGCCTEHFPLDETTQAEVYRYYEMQSTYIRLSILETHDAIADALTCCLYQSLDRSYPGSKFVLTIRKKNSWLESCERHWSKHINHVLRDNSYDPEKVDDPVVKRLFTKVNQEFLFAAFLQEKLYGFRGFDRQIFSRAYDRYNGEVLRYFQHRERDLLTLDICGGEGWEKLAPFLEMTAPRLPFPYVK